MKGKILVTDSLFIFDEHVRELKAAGYEIERLDMPTATEEQLIKAIKGKVGYILGGIERVTDAVIEAADELKVIVFTGADYQSFIPGWQRAKERGVAIANTPGANKFAVSEFAVAVALALQRNIFELGRTGSKAFQTTGSLKDVTIGVVGLGRIGGRIVELVQAFEPRNVYYYNRTRSGTSLAEYADLNTIAETSDVIFVAVPESAGQLFDGVLLKKVKKGALIVSISSTNIFDLEILLDCLRRGDIRTAIDHPSPSEAFTMLPLDTWFNTNAHTAYNTHEANRRASDAAVSSIINLLQTGEDEQRVV